MRRALVVLAAAAFPALAQETPRLAVLDFVANGASPQLASAANGMVANELQRMGLFKITTSEMVRSLMAHERQMQLMGCAEEKCVSGLSNVLGVDYLVTGKVSKIPGGRDMPTTYTLELALLLAAKGAREGSDIQTALSEADLTAKVPRSVAKLVQKILSARGGSLIVEVAEAGATVKVDDVVVGTTPLAGRVPLSAGPHFVIVEKEGFVSAQKEIKLAPNQLAQETLTIVPSPDFIRAYEGRTGAMRLGGWLTTGLAGAGAGVALFFQAQAQARYGSVDLPGTFAYHRNKLLEGVEAEGMVDHRYQAESLGAQVQQLETLSYLGMGVGGASAALAAFFWIAGEDPGRYARFRQVELKKPEGPPRASLLVAPAAGGAYGAVAVSF